MRKNAAPRRDLDPDPVYESIVVTQFVNKVLQRGKRSTAERIVYGALEIVSDKTGGEILTEVDQTGRERPLTTSYKAQALLSDEDGTLRLTGTC